MAKRNINFEVYERQDPSSQVDWSKAAADITKTFTDIRDVRREKKDEINQQFLDTQDVLNDLGEYENQTMQEFVMNASNDGANKLYDFNNLVKRGLANPADQSMFTHNLKTDMKLLKKNATNFDNAFKAYAERTQLGENADAEEFFAGQIEGFANINNLRGETNSETGRIGLVRFDEEGNPVKDESMTVQRLTVLMNQRIDKFDLPKQLSEAISGIGKLVSEEVARGGRNYSKLTKTEQTALTKKYIEDNKDNKTFQDFLGARVSLFLGSPQQTADYLVRHVAGPNGEAAGTYYKNGTQDDFDAWEKDNAGVKSVKVPELPPGDMTTEGTEFRKWLRETYSEYATDNDISAEGSNDWAPLISAYAEYGQEYAKDFLGIEPTTTKGVNPYIVQEIGGDNLAKAIITDEQREIAGTGALENITNSQAFSVTKEFKVTGQNAPAPRYKPEYIYDRENEVIENFSDIDQANMLLTGGNDAFQNASQYFASKINRDATITRKLDPVTPFDRSDADFLIVNFADGSPSERISRYQTDEGGNVIIGPNGKIPADLKRNISSLLSMAGTGTKNSNQVMKEYEKRKGAVKSLKSDDEIKSDTAVTKQKTAKDMNISAIPLGYEDGQKITISDKLTTIFKAGGADEQVIGDAANEVRKVLIKGLDGVTTNIKVDIEDQWGGDTNAIIVTINGVTKTIEFDYKTGQNTLINGVQDAVNDAIKKIKAAQGGTGGTGGKEVETESGRTYK